MARKWLLLFLLIICSFSTAVQAIAAPKEVRHYVVEVQAVAPESTGEYFPTLLVMILNASKAPDEVIDFVFSDRHFVQARWIAEVQNNDNNNIMWTITTKEREQMLRPIRVPILKGLLGTRVLVIRKQDQEKFAQITTKEQLAKRVAGQGTRWPDNDILTANGLPVITAVTAPILYKMLKANRFDYFPRGIIEFPAEAKHITDNDLVVEENILLSYPAPMYFFVNNKNVELAKRIEKGWEIIIKNGEFDKLFFSLPEVVAMIAELKKYKRKIIHLDNPNLPSETPLQNPAYWLDVSKY